MNDSRVFADNFGTTFSEENSFLSFLKERHWHSWWQVKPASELHFVALDEESKDVDQTVDEYRQTGMEDVIKDTMENTRLLLKAECRSYPVRSCAIKSILDRAKVGGSALGKVEKSVLAKILNYCLDVSTGNALLRFSEGKISAVHGGDESEYAILEMPELFEAMAEYLKDTYSGCTFAGAFG